MPKTPGPSATPPTPARASAGPAPQPRPQARLLCPYCGATSTDLTRCSDCGGLFEPLSRQATQNGMGPWYIRDERQPFHPGCSYEVVVAMVQRGQIGPRTIIRGPSTRQFWTFAKRCPGVAHLLGICHACGAPARPEAGSCTACGVEFRAPRDRQHLGLGGVHPVPRSVVVQRPE